MSNCARVTEKGWQEIQRRKQINKMTSSEIREKTRKKSVLPTLCVVGEENVEYLSRAKLENLFRQLLVVYGVVLILFVVCFSLIFYNLGKGDDVLSYTDVDSYVVQQGDSLWEIAADLDSEYTVPVLVDEIMRINGLTESKIYKGEILMLPIFDS